MTPQTDRRDFVVVPAPREPREIRREQSRTTTSPLLFILAAIVVPIAFACGAAVGDELQILGVVLALIGLMVICARPFYGLILFVALLYTRPEESLQALADMHFTLAVAVVTLVSMWFHMFMKKDHFVRAPFLFMVLSFGATVVAGSLQVDNLSDAGQDMGRLMILVILILNVVRTKDQYRQLVTALLVFTTYLAGYSIYLYFHGGAVSELTGGDFYATRFLRAQGTGIFNDPNDLAATIVAGLGLGLSRLPSASKGGKAFYIAVSAIMIWAILLTNSRGGMIAFMAVLFGFFFITLKNKKVAIVLGILAALGALALGSGHMTNFDSSESSANSRFRFWHTAFDELTQHPVLGVGYNGFPSTNDGATAHNSFVLCYVENGVVGYFFFIGCIYYCFRRPPKPALEGDANEEDEESGRKELLGARLGLFGYLAASFWLSHTYEPIMYVMLPLPILAQLCWTHGANIYRGIKPSRDWRNIAVIAVSSIFLIELMADHYINK
ncbi:MAG TPA: O-antigen ligase family protein [Capsulimonadaceae bacterium]|nr:O-antigen ligase family protein [Capsulimonadaceae bacterium]